MPPYHSKMPTTRTGFTLIELSIVLVIIGLIIGGVLVGRDLIEAASVRKQGSYIASVQTAINTFRLKYNCSPGDCKNATTYWGKNSTLCNYITDTAATPGTCNGNGDQRINIATFENATWRYEYDYFHQHLALAQLVDWPWASNMAGLPKNSFINGQQYVMDDSPNIDTNLWPNAILSAPVYWMLDGTGTSANSALLARLDMKYDDGIPNTGKYRTDWQGVDGNADSCVANDRTYRMTGGVTTDCALLVDLSL